MSSLTYVLSRFAPFLTCLQALNFRFRTHRSHSVILFSRHPLTHLTPSQPLGLSLKVNSLEMLSLTSSYLKYPPISDIHCSSIYFISSSSYYYLQYYHYYYCLPQICFFYFFSYLFFVCCTQLEYKLHEGSIISVLSTTESPAWTHPMPVIIICGTSYQRFYFTQLFVFTPRFLLCTVFEPIASSLHQCTLFPSLRFHSASWTVILNLSSCVYQNADGKVL